MAASTGAVFMFCNGIFNPNEQDARVSAKIIGDAFKVKVEIYHTKTTFTDVVSPKKEDIQKLSEKINGYTRNNEVVLFAHSHGVCLVKEALRNVELKERVAVYAFGGTEFVSDNLAQRVANIFNEDDTFSLYVAIKRQENKKQRIYSVDGDGDFFEEEYEPKLDTTNQENKAECTASAPLITKAMLLGPQIILENPIKIVFAAGEGLNKTISFICSVPAKAAAHKLESYRPAIEKIAKTWPEFLPQGLFLEKSGVKLNGNGNGPNGEAIG